MAWPITDNFNRADSTTLGTMSDGVHSWNEISAGLEIVTNKLKSIGEDNAAIVTESHSETDYYVQAIIADAGKDPGVIARCTDFNNFYLWQSNNGSWGLYKKVAGSFTLINNWAGSSGTFTARLEVEGTTLRAYVDGSLKLTETDTALTSGAPGVRVYGTGCTWDDFEAGLLTAAGGPPVGTLMMMGVGV